jgi:hypothetical protein
VLIASLFSCMLSIPDWAGTQSAWREKLMIKSCVQFCDTAAAERLLKRSGC